MGLRPTQLKVLEELAKYHGPATLDHLVLALQQRPTAVGRSLWSLAGYPPPLVRRVGEFWEITRAGRLALSPKQKS